MPTRVDIPFIALEFKPSNTSFSVRWGACIVPRSLLISLKCYAILSVNTTNGWRRYYVRHSHHIQYLQISVEIWLSEATHCYPGFGSSLYQYGCIYLVSQRFLFLCTSSLFGQHSISGHRYPGTSAELVSCIAANRPVKFLAQGSTYWVASVGSVIGQSKRNVPNTGWYNADSQWCRLCELHVGRVSSIMPHLIYILNRISGQTQCEKSDPWPGCEHPRGIHHRNGGLIRPAVFLLTHVAYNITSQSIGLGVPSSYWCLCSYCSEAFCGP